MDHFLTGGVTPKGLSGAPLLSMRSNSPFCYGYMVQQSTIGLGTDPSTPVGIAVSIEMILGVNSLMAGGPLAKLFGKEFTPVPPPVPKPLPGGLHRPSQAELETGWPEDDLPAEGNGEGT